jgi:norsolorinic acid ketoreductase
LGLEDIPAASGSKLILVKIESASFTDPAQAVNELESQGITKLDLVIANAAIYGKAVLPVADGDAEDFANILAVNTVGPLALFAATKLLLDHAEKPKWVSVSSSVASISNHEATFAYMGGRPMGFGYGASKAALNYLTLNIHSENPNLTVIALDPG